MGILLGAHLSVYVMILKITGADNEQISKRTHSPAPCPFTSHKSKVSGMCRG